ncbi:hypothetical protein [Psychrobium sp. 1_MG-2023]|uniref:hypothetical protein n=1 Tax=Psychrobium sp. 1_MG-2023 TaxID=3062624 RepID=UPI000C320CA0|nr:hypothetical protein [Psychrobium sp. 1_MG-2023]MDP2562812.1 hypothetical protein [Psychrobium sp. 1_MG-2023]PKF54439.1 hypothetical protein CW748_15830 [Alteromonadales bacterium alter-6D02]
MSGISLALNRSMIVIGIYLILTACSDEISDRQQVPVMSPEALLNEVRAIQTRCSNTELQLTFYDKCLHDLKELKQHVSLIIIENQLVKDDYSPLVSYIDSVIVEVNIISADQRRIMNLLAK